MRKRTETSAGGVREARLRIASDTGDGDVATLTGTGVAAPAVAPPKPAARPSASCARHSARAARCRFSLPGVTGWSDTKVALMRGKRTVASGRALAWRGRASLELRGRSRLRGGGYALVMRARGRAPVSLPVALR